VLAAEVVVQQRQRHPGIARDVPQAGASKPVLGEVAVCGDKDCALALHEVLLVDLPVEAAGFTEK
jgi:hypothetical protein